MNSDNQVYQSAFRALIKESFGILSTTSQGLSSLIASAGSVTVTGPITTPIPPPHWPNLLDPAKKQAAALDELISQLGTHQKTFASLIAAAEAI